MNRLKDKRALMTGGTSGIGLETAHRFLAEGARVAITGTNPATLESAQKELGSDALIVRVNAVSPAPISTPLYGKFGLSAADLQTVSASIRSQVPMGNI